MTYNNKQDIPVFGKQVSTFPQGIQEAFDELVDVVGGFNRPFYGVSWMEGDKVIYYALVEERSGDVVDEKKFKRMKIHKGEYLTETILNWHEKIDSINTTFHKLMEDKRIEHGHPCVEWYKSDEEMVCMVKMKR
jgi:hypothetical protein